MTPIEITSGTLAVANGIFTLTTNFWKLRSVDGDLEVCLRLLEMITKDLNYARKLRNRKYLRGRKPDASLARVESAIEDLDTTAKQIGKSIEASRVEKALHKSISIVTRFAWVYNGKDNFIAQQWAVQAAQTRVLQVITSMEAMPDIQEKPVAPPTYEEALLRSPSQLRALKGKNLSIIRAKGDHSKGKRPPCLHLLTPACGPANTTCSIIDFDDQAYYFNGAAASPFSIRT